MIPYVEILDKYTLKRFATVEPNECWFELTYYDYGEFELYCRASNNNLRNLKKGHYVKLPNKRFIWLITGVRYTFNAEGARMILVTGKEAKWLLYKRVIQSPLELQGTITQTVYKLVNNNLGTSATIERAITDNNGNYKFNVDANNLLIDISGTQAPRGNLLEFVNTLLKTYNCGSQVIYENGLLKYQILNGTVRNNVKFSQSLDNLLSSEYYTTDESKATNALVVSTVEEVDYLETVDAGAKGIDRAEILINSNLSTKYTDANGAEKETTPTSSLYKDWLKEEGRNELAKHVSIEEANGVIDLANSNYKFDQDFYIGDLVKIQDEYFNFTINSRITKYTISQKGQIYNEEAEYGGL